MATNSWSQGPAISLAREAHSCNLIEDCKGNKQVVVVGGWSPDVLHDEYGYNGTTINSTEIYDVTTGVWSEGNQLLIKKLLEKF